MGKPNWARLQTIIAALALILTLLGLIYTISHADPKNSNNNNIDNNAGGAITYGNNNNVTIVNNPKSEPTSNIQDEEICYYDWKGESKSNITVFSEKLGTKIYSAPNGSTFFLVTLYLKNDANQSIQTNPIFWHLKQKGIEYPADDHYTNMLNNRYVYPILDKGGESETKIVYIEKEVTFSEADIVCLNYMRFKMQRIKHY